MSCHAVIGSNLRRQYLLMLPLPLCASGRHCRLHGIAYMHLDAGFNPIGSKRLLLCRTPPHVLPTPSYMLSLGINPQSACQALSELEFYEQIARLLHENPCLVTYSFPYLDALNAIGLRIFKDTNIFAALEQVIDVRQALCVSRLFGHTPPGPSDLLCNAQQAGFGALNPYDHLRRLDALAFLFTSLIRSEPHIMAYCFTPLAGMQARLQEASRSGSCFLQIQGMHIQLFKCLACRQLTLRGLVIGNEPHVFSLPLLCHRFLCPASVLTPERQRHLGIDLQREQDNLEMACQELHNLPQRRHGCFEQELQSLPAGDRSFYMQLAACEPRSQNATPLNVSSAMRRRHFLFKGDNLYATLTDSEQERYRNYCTAQLSARLPAYERAVSTLYDAADPDDQLVCQKLQDIAAYPAGITLPPAPGPHYS